MATIVAALETICQGLSFGVSHSHRSGCLARRVRDTQRRGGAFRIRTLNGTLLPRMLPGRRLCDKQGYQRSSRAAPRGGCLDNRSVAREWEQFSEAEYAHAALDAARRHAVEVSRRLGRYRSFVGEPWLEGPPPQLVMLVRDEDGGRHERRFDLPLRDQPPVLAKYLVEDAVARLPDAPSAIPRSCDEAWRDLRALAWPKAPEHTRATVHRGDAAAMSLEGRIGIRRDQDQASDVFVGEQHLFDFVAGEFCSAELWTADGDLFCLTLEFSWGRVELQGG